MGCFGLFLFLISSLRFNQLHGQSSFESRLQSQERVADAEPFWEYRQLTC